MFHAPLVPQPHQQQQEEEDVSLLTKFLEQFICCGCCKEEWQCFDSLMCTCCGISITSRRVSIILTTHEHGSIGYYTEYHWNLNKYGAIKYFKGWLPVLHDKSSYVVVGTVKVPTGNIRRFNIFVDRSFLCLLMHTHGASDHRWLHPFL